MYACDVTHLHMVIGRMYSHSLLTILWCASSLGMYIRQEAHRWRRKGMPFSVSFTAITDIRWHITFNTISPTSTETTGKRGWWRRSAWETVHEIKAPRLSETGEQAYKCCLKCWLCEWDVKTCKWNCGVVLCTHCYQLYAAGWDVTGSVAASTVNFKVYGPNCKLHSTNSYHVTFWGGV